jgi:periplasmic mercuric ion binding protein
MKKIVFALVLSGFLFACGSKAPEGSATSTFKVWGNCGMCKKTIEKSLKQDGIFSADWNKDSKIMEVVYDPKKLSLEQINASIASVGYDTETARGNDSAYATLHECCQYERK